MEQQVHNVAGGIVGLQRYIQDHAEAVNYELIRIGLTLADIGEGLSWADARDFINNLPADSALHRHVYPKSWWWTPEIDFQAAILHSLQLANWQRGGGKGPRPRMVTRPREGGKGAPKTLEEARARKKALQDELARRRERREVDSG